MASRIIGDEAVSASENSPQKTDRFTTWSILLIIAVVAFQLFQNDGDALIKKFSHKQHLSESVTLSTESFERLDEIDLRVKTAYVVRVIPPSLSAVLADKLVGPPDKADEGLSPFHRAIKKTLSDCLAGLRSDRDGTYFARRVILLRLLLDQAPFAPIPAVGKVPGLNSPLDAFELSADEHPDTAKLVLREAQFWKSTFGPSILTKLQLRQSLQTLNTYPTLLFYSLIARQQIFLRAGSFGEAKAADHAMQQRAMSSLISLGCSTSVMLLLLASGFVVWIAVLVTLAASGSGMSPTSRFIVPLPSRITDSDRGLRAGDLLNCFAIYLLSLTGIGTVLSLLFGAVPKSEIYRLSTLQVTYLDIAFALISYVGASWLALAVLSSTAKRKGASLSIELGLSRFNFGRNILYGAVGWGASLLLMAIVSSGTQHLFHSLPAPENPALPMLSFAPNTLCRFALYGLAAIAAPFFEETFFRGVLLNALLLRFKPLWACLIVGLMFGGIHPVGPVEALTLASLGTVFAWMAYLRKSLVPSMFAHCLQNSFAYTTVYLTFSVIAHR